MAIQSILLALLHSKYLTFGNCVVLLQLLLHTSLSSYYLSSVLQCSWYDNTKKYQLKIFLQ